MQFKYYACQPLPSILLESVFEVSLSLKSGKKSSIFIGFLAATPTYLVMPQRNLNQP